MNIENKYKKWETINLPITREDMANYIGVTRETISRKLKKFEDKEKEEVAAYMKINFDKAQTESGHDNTLEVQRIYVLEEYKGKKIGKSLIQKAIQTSKDSNLDYVWLGVWEHNINAIRFYEKQEFENLILIFSN